MNQLFQRRNLKNHDCDNNSNICSIINPYPKFSQQPTSASCIISYTFVPSTVNPLSLACTFNSPNVSPQDAHPHTSSSPPTPPDPYPLLQFPAPPLSEVISEIPVMAAFVITRNFGVVPLMECSVAHPIVRVRGTERS